MKIAIANGTIVMKKKVNKWVHLSPNTNDIVFIVAGLLSLSPSLIKCAYVCISMFIKLNQPQQQQKQQQQHLRIGI